MVTTTGKLITLMSSQAIEKHLTMWEVNGQLTAESVGINPFTSPIPLEALQNYKLIYSSKSGISISHQKAGLIPEVEISEYL